MGVQEETTCAVTILHMRQICKREREKNAWRPSITVLTGENVTPTPHAHIAQHLIAYTREINKKRGRGEVEHASRSCLPAHITVARREKPTYYL